MDFYLTDEVDVVLVTRDADGVETTTTVASVKARVAERHKLLIDKDGQEVAGSMQVILPLATEINHDSRIKVKKLDGVAYSLSSKEWKVITLSTGHAIDPLFKEVWV